MSTDIPSKQWDYGRLVKHDEKAWYSEPAIKAMEKGLLAKFSQNDNLCQTLLTTPKRPFWQRYCGIGMGIYHPQAAEQS